MRIIKWTHKSFVRLLISNFTVNVHTFVEPVHTHERESTRSRESLFLSCSFELDRNSCCCCCRFFSFSMCPHFWDYCHQNNINTNNNNHYIKKRKENQNFIAVVCGSRKKHRHFVAIEIDWAQWLRAHTHTHTPKSDVTWRDLYSSVNINQQQKKCKPIASHLKWVQ